jgi:hypothetical protein
LSVSIWSTFSTSALELSIAILFFPVSTKAYQSIGQPTAAASVAAGSGPIRVPHHAGPFNGTPVKAEPSARHPAEPWAIIRRKGQILVGAASGEWKDEV